VTDLQRLACPDLERIELKIDTVDEVCELGIPAPVPGCGEGLRGGLRIGHAYQVATVVPGHSATRGACLGSCSAPTLRPVGSLSPIHWLIFLIVIGVLVTVVGVLVSVISRSSSTGRRTAPLIRTAQPAGWFPDQADPRLLRWFDGQRWTAQTRPR